MELRERGREGRERGGKRPRQERRKEIGRDIQVQLAIRGGDGNVWL